MTYSQLINKTITDLKNNNLNTEVAFDLLFGLSATIKDKMDFIKSRDYQIDDTFLNEYKKAIDDFIINKKPLARILGFAYFHNNQFDIFNNVFAFRKETEFVLDWALKISKEFNWINNVLDACCGTGVLGLSYKFYQPQKDVTLVDINPIAIENTKHNQIKNKIENTTIINDSIFDYVLQPQKKYDLLMCNPPYIKSNFILEDQVSIYDPKESLYDFSNKDGIGFYVFLLKNIKSFMNDKYVIIFEIGFDQYDVLKSFLIANHFDNYLFIKDYNNLWRYLIISSEGLWKYIDSQN